MRSTKCIAGKSAMPDKAEEALMRPRITFLGAAAAWCLVSGAGAHPPCDCRPGDQTDAVRQDEAWVANRVAAWQPTAEESAFDRVDWVKNLREARHVSRSQKRPMFLFTYDGTSISGYRC
jgi:hypothetical protein